ncbi:MAG: FISUMP domain-containing protein [bacterium]
MRKKILFLISFISVFVLSTCKDYDFQNPIDPDAEFIAPSNLNITEFTETSAKLEWMDNSTFELGFEIEKSEDGTTYVTVNTVDANIKTAVIDGTYLTTKQYYFRVRAKSNYYYSKYSNIVSQSLQFNAPANLLVTSFTKTMVILTWTDNSTFETGFEIEKSEDGSTYTIVKTVGANIKTATIEGSYITTKQYSFRVRAKSNFNYSSYSSVEYIPFACGTATLVYAGRTYNTVYIEGQCWLKENLDVGSKIIGSLDQTNNNIIEKYCYNDDTTNCNTYGGLYRWAEVVQYKNGASNTISPSPAFTGNLQGICPTGWHIPTLTEFETLKAAVNNDGNKLKREDQGTGSGVGTNTSGFSALLAGAHDTNVDFHNLGYDAVFWSCTEYDAAGAYGLNLLLFYDYNIELYASPKKYGFSVRCLKDDY